MRYIVFLCTILLFVLPTSAQEATIAELLAERSELSQFASLLEGADPSIWETLNDPDAEFTLFAPTNAAFEALDDVVSQADSWQRDYLGVDSLDEFLANDELINEMLLLHLTEGIITWDNLLDDLRGNFAAYYLSLNGFPLSISATFDNTGDLVVEQGVRIFGEASIDQNNTDIEARNGQIFLLDVVLLPEQLTIMDYMNAVAADEEYPEYTHLVALINAADPAISEMLSDPDAEITLFTPYDIAFDELDNFDEIVGDSDEATAFLSGYILPEAIYSFQIKALLEAEGQAEAETLNGELLSFSIEGRAFFGEFNVNDIVVFYPNFAMRNGVMHEMETLIPAND